jgi:hypothetical protein
MSLKDLKKNRQSYLSKLSEKIDSMTKKSYGDKDDRLWYPSVDKAGNGYAVIRFLPPHKDEDIPFVKLYHKGFQGPTGKWFIENCLSTIDQQDPVLEWNSKAWASKDDDRIAIAKRQKRKTNYYTNVLVIKDSINPQNDGKVFIFRFGPKIFDKINAKLHPAFEDEKQINVFDPWEGATFKLKTRTLDGQRNYEASEFEPAGPLFPGDKNDEKLNEVYEKIYPLQPFVASDKFKSYADLKKKFEEVNGFQQERMVEEDEDDVIGEEEAPAPRKTASSKKVVEEPAEEVEESEFDESEFFANLDNE